MPILVNFFVNGAQSNQKISRLYREVRIALLATCSRRRGLAVAKQYSELIIWCFFGFAGLARANEISLPRAARLNIWFKGGAPLRREVVSLSTDRRRWRP